MPTYFLYVRKSTESEDRQVQSIESQIKELSDYAQRSNITIERIFTESMSAKQPGRPVFSQMMKIVWKGKVHGVLCWKLDRLARNPVDGSNLIWAFDKERLAEILTPNQIYRNNANDKFMMQLEFGMAKKYVDDLSENVKRGLRAKIEKGWRPGIAPLGYLNDKTGETGQKKILNDTERFHLIKKMWQMMLSGLYSPTQILEMANTKWNLRTRPMTREGGRPLVRSAIYAIFTNPFYCGLIEHKGELYPGKHEPMVTVGEFERVQRILGRNGNPRAKSYTFTYRGLLHCGECGAMITAEQKRKLLKGKNITKLYHYYHCTKRKDPNCTQGSIEEKELESQIAEYLQRIEIPQFLYEWAVNNLNKLQLQERNENQEYLEKHKKSLEKYEHQLSNLIRLKIAPENADGHILSDDEFTELKNKLLMEKLQLVQEFNQRKTMEEECNELTRQTFEFACYSRLWFKNGTPEQRAAILSALGSNHKLLNKKVLMQANGALAVLENKLERLKTEFPMFEPMNFSYINRQTATVTGGLSANLGLVDDVRTAVKKCKEIISYPKFSLKAIPV